MYLLVLNERGQEDHILINPTHITSIRHYEEGSVIHVVSASFGIIVKQSPLEILQAMGVEACDGVTVQIGQM